MADAITEEKVFVVGNKILFPVPATTVSPQDLGLDDEEKTEGSTPRESEADASEFCELPSFKASTSYSEAKQDSQWRGFFRKLKPAMNLHPFHPTIPAIKKLSKKKSGQLRKTMPGLPDLDTEFYCFESSWLNFSLAELQDATNNFSRDNLIGEGGYSEVYKGVLEDGKLVAIKRLTRGTAEEMTSDFLSELGILVHVNHPNIANVFGYGVEGGMHLVLPLSPHGSLASLLTGEKQKLKWEVRYNIALGIASGLSYLHEGCQRRIIHRDIKAANILLTEEFEPQISDFGLAKWLPDQWSHLTVSQFEGTFGYLPPEFFLHGLVDEKTDVYAYGVLVLELITGRPALDKSQKSLVMWAKPLLAKKNIKELVDPLLAGAYDAEQISNVVSIVSMCINEISTERPCMSQVVRFLKGNEGIFGSEKKFQKRPAFKRSDDEEFDDSPTSSLNDVNQQNQIALEL